MTLLGIDIGTTGVRALAVDRAGTVVASASRPTPPVIDGRRAETDAAVVGVAVDDAIRELVAGLAEPVVAVSFSTQGEAVVPVSAAGLPLAFAPISMDRRGDLAEKEITAALGDGAFARITGQPAHPMFSVHKIAAGGDAWTAADVKGYLTLDAFVAARLGAAPTTDFSMAARTGLFDAGALGWSAAVIDAARSAGASRLSAGMLPRVVAPGEAIGTVSAEASERTGLREGTLIAAGAHDQAAAYFGAGGVAGRRSVFSLGSSDCLTVGSTERPDGLTDTGFASYPVSADRWLTLAGTAAGGWALEWFAGILGSGVAHVFDDPSPAPSSVMVLPYFVGSGTLDNDPTARGAIVGLTLDTTRSELSRAFLESGALELAKIADALAEKAGLRIGDIVSVGGGAANRQALGIRASAAGRALTPGPDHASARGAALLAGVGAGVFPGVGELPPPAVGEPIAPDPATREWYSRLRATYRELYLALRPLTNSLGTTKEKP